jgi:hypothetical protein
MHAISILILSAAFLVLFDGILRAVSIIWWARGEPQGQPITVCLSDDTLITSPFVEQIQ